MHIFAPRIGLATAVLLGLSSVASADVLRMGGTGAATAFLPALFAPFERSEGVKLKVIPSLGSTGGLRALEDEVLDIAVSGRALKPEEIKHGLKPVAAIRTPFVLVTSHARPDRFKSTDIADIFNAQNATWSDGVPVRIILRPKNDSDTPILAGTFPGMAAAMEKARRRPDVPIAATDQDNASLAERMSGSLAGSSFTQMKTEQRSLRLIAIDGVEPALEHFQTGAYPFGRSFLFVLPVRIVPAAERFIAYLRTNAGQAALHATGNLLMDD